MEDARAPAKESCQVHKRFKYCQSRVLIDVSAAAKCTAAHTVDSLLNRDGLEEKLRGVDRSFTQSIISLTVSDMVRQHPISWSMREFCDQEFRVRVPSGSSIPCG